VGVAALIVFDVALGQIAVRRFNLGVRRGALAQLAIGAGALFVSGAIGVAVAPHLPIKRKAVDPYMDLVPVERPAPIGPPLVFPRTITVE
jgi:hypothetical protein